MKAWGEARSAQPQARAKRGADFDEGRHLFPEDARDIGMELIPFLVAQELAAAFGAEHEMNNNVGKGLGHNVRRPYRAWDICCGGG